ncbi:Dyp-type peroxidase [Streptomyces sp. NPDC001415]
MSVPRIPRRTLLATLPVAFALSGCDSAPPRERPLRPAQGPPPGPARQVGVTERQTPYALFVSYDLTPNTSGAPGRDAVRRLLARWSESLTGLEAGAGATVGIGPTLPTRLGVGAPEGLRELPPFPGERLDAGAGGGEIGVQISARDPQACERVAWLLAGAGAGVLRPRWRQAGFLPAELPGPGTAPFTPPRDGETPRNLLGFKHGTANPTAEECARWVWLSAPGPYADGTFLVVRRVRLRTEEFGRLPVARQEQIIGRRKRGGEPLGGGAERDQVDLDARTSGAGPGPGVSSEGSPGGSAGASPEGSPGGNPGGSLGASPAGSPEGGYVLPADAHVRLANPRLDGGARMLRRGYAYENSPADRGLLFLAYMNDPALFVRVQRRLAAGDALNSFAEHYGSALFYVLPGALPDRPLGSGVL